ncbi:MAG: FAD-dependent oxidoreductase [Boseongicola sp.]|nr:FAD-dependent oxidoreductase [Boseongicola sp.]
MALGPSIAVIGRGLIGSAAARHLAANGHDVTLVGPAEPKEKREHQGVFGSHYDEGRITRRNATDRYWAEASIASIARYGEIERSSGIGFFSPVGALMAGADDGEFLGGARQVSAELSILHQDLRADQLGEVIPDLTLQSGWSALWEPEESGHISPRRLVAAQTKLAAADGATLLDVAVTGLEETASGARIQTADGSEVFDRVLVAAGGMTDHVLGRAPSYRVCGRTVALFELTEAEAERLGYLPSLVMGTPEGHYLLPPIRYPDGNIYMKLGGDPDDILLWSPRDIGDWFRCGGRAEVRDDQEARFRALFPGVKVVSVTMDACMTTWTDDLRPEIARLSDRIFVASAGNGAGAKCSDELGRRGAALVTDDFLEG